MLDMKNEKAVGRQKSRHKTKTRKTQTSSKGKHIICMQVCGNKIVSYKIKCILGSTCMIIIIIIK